MSKRFDDVEDRRLYLRNHQRVGRQLGKASEYLCEHCDKVANEWSQIHDTDGSSNDHFVSLCHKCHQIYDNRWNEKERKKLSESNKRDGKIPPSQLGKKRSEETKRKMSEAQKRRHARERALKEVMPNGKENALG